VNWNSSNPVIATVNSTGLVTPVSEGPVTISATSVENNTISGTVNIAVTAPIVPVTPGYPSDVNDVAATTGINANDLEKKPDGKVYLKKTVADAIAKKELNVNAVDTEILPVMSADISPVGGIGQVTISVTGKQLLASLPQDINLIGVISGDAGTALGYITNLANADDGTFMLLSGGAVFTGPIDPNATYELVVFIKDGGLFDLDGAADGKALFSLFFADEKKGGGGGCNAYGFAFALLAAIPFVLRRKK
jgi:Synergist-CTERM protein sorting domain-containing protein